MLIGTDGVYSYTFEHERKPDCPVCGGESLELSISSEMTVELLIEMLTERQNMYVPSFPCDNLCLVVSLTALALVFFLVVKLRNLRYQPRRSRSTSRHRHSLRLPHDQTWRRRSQSWFQMEERSPSRPLLSRLVYHFAFRIINSGQSTFASRPRRVASQPEHKLYFFHVSNVDVAHVLLPTRIVRQRRAFA